MLLYSPEADALRAVLRDVLEWNYVEDTPGWLIFALPPSEIGVHPSDGATKHEVCLMCDDLAATMADFARRGSSAAASLKRSVSASRRRLLLPGGVEVLLYQPTHASPLGL